MGRESDGEGDTGRLWSKCQMFSDDIPAKHSSVDLMKGIAHISR